MIDVRRLILFTAVTAKPVLSDIVEQDKYNIGTLVFFLFGLRGQTDQKTKADTDSLDQMLHKTSNFDAE